MLAGVLAVGALVMLVIPCWRYGDDSGWYSCGPLWNKPSGGLAEGCEFSGVYRRRLLWVLAVVLAAVVAAAVRFAGDPAVRARFDRRRFVAVALGAATMVVGGTLLWIDNDARYVPAVYDFSATQMSAVPIGTTDDGRVRFQIDAVGWPSQGYAVFMVCRSNLVPASCDRMYASDVVQPTPDGVISEPIELPVGADTEVIVGLDFESMTLDTWQPGSFVATPYVAPVGDLDEVADPVGASPASGPATTPVETGVQPVGFELTSARVTEADGTVCVVCLWVADSVELRNRG